MLKKILLSFVASSVLLLANNIETIEKTGTTVDKKILKDTNYDISISKGYFDSDKNEILYLLHIKSNTKQELQIEEKNTLKIEPNKVTKTIISESKLEDFLNTVKFEQRIQVRLNKLKEEHSKEINTIKKMAKSKLLEILDYTKKLENNILNLKEGVKKMKETHVSKNILVNKENEIKRLNQTIIERNNTSISPEEYQIVTSQLIELKEKNKNSLVKKDLIIKTLKEELKKLKMSSTSKSELEKVKSSLSITKNTLNKKIKENEELIKKIEKDNSSISLLNKLKENVKDLPTSYDKEILMYTIEDMKTIFK